jgi:predicted Zn-dependent peptidase
MGTVTAIERMTRDDQVAFHQRQFVPEGARLVVCGDVEPAWRVDRFEAAFSGRATGPQGQVDTSH